MSAGFETPSTSDPSAAASAATTSKRTVTYICGECRAETPIKPRELVRCLECGHRVLYKKRSNRILGDSRTCCFDSLPVVGRNGFHLNNQQIARSRTPRVK
uniref:DNA-directed RNA polymerases I, II, and III subunit RPABC4 n=1 Tax=Mesocestoides corti TaxID=53468 RepID=A0A5K3EYK8_MESCO